MRAEKVVKTLLEGAAGVGALVGSRIYAAQLPLGSPLPSLVYALVDASRRPPFGAVSGSSLSDARIQVTCFALAYHEVKELAEQVRLACDRKAGSIAGVSVVAVLLELEGPDLFEQTSGFHYQPLDFIVTHFE